MALKKHHFAPECSRGIPCQTAKIYYHFHTLCYLPFCSSCGLVINMLLTRSTYELFQLQPLCKRAKTDIFGRNTNHKQSTAKHCPFWGLQKVLCHCGGWDRPVREKKAVLNLDVASMSIQLEQRCSAGQLRSFHSATFCLDCLRM